MACRVLGSYFRELGVEGFEGESAPLDLLVGFVVGGWFPIYPLTLCRNQRFKSPNHQSN